MTTPPPPGPTGPTGPYGQYPSGPGGGPTGPTGPTGQVCTWHPDRATNLTCSRCGRPACPSCLAPASVGFHCRACVAESRPVARVTSARTVVGARLSGQPRVTYALIALNVLVFIVVAAQAGSVSHFGRSTVFNGSMLVPMVVAGGEWWRLVTSGFLHLSITHIALNMLALYFIGMGLERVLGTWRYLALYLLSLLGGSACVMLFASVNSASAGASGAIFGLMGALLVTLKKLRLDMRQAMIIIAINVFATFAIPGISWQAHLGGLVVGAAVGAGIVFAPPVKRFQWQVGVCVAAFVILLAVFVTKDLTLGNYECINTLSPHVKCLVPT